MGGRTGGLVVGGLAVVVGVCHYTIASSILVTTIVKLNFFIIKCQFEASMAMLQKPTPRWLLLKDLGCRDFQKDVCTVLL